jgi:hypothetical protein
MASVKLFVGRLEGVKTEVLGLRTKCPVSVRRIMLQQLQHPNYTTDFDQTKKKKKLKLSPLTVRGGL